MSQEIIQASLLRIKSSIVETYEALKVKVANHTEEGQVEEVAQMAIRLANLEGGFITLQQYAEQILAENKAKELQMRAEVEQLLQAEPPTPEEIEETPTPREQVITEDDLLKRSTVFRNSQEDKPAPKKKRTTKKRKPARKEPKGTDES